MGLEREIKELDRQIKEARRAATTALTLEDKLAGQKQIRALEAQRNEKRRSLFDAQDRVDSQRDELILAIEGSCRSRPRQSGCSRFGGFYNDCATSVSRGEPKGRSECLLWRMAYSQTTTWGIKLCNTSGIHSEDHFADAGKPISGGRVRPHFVEACERVIVSASNREMT